MFAEIELKYKDCVQNENNKESFIVTSDQMDYLIYELESGLETIERLEKAESKRN